MTYLPDMALSKNIPRDQCALLISIVGVTNILGRLLSGVVTDVLHVRSIHIYACALAVASVVNFILPFADNFYILAVCAGIFGLCMGKFKIQNTSSLLVGIVDLIEVAIMFKL